MNVKNRIIDLLNNYKYDKYSNIYLNNYFNANKINEKEKGFITEVFYGVIRNKIFIDYCINKYTKKVKKKWIESLFSLSIYQAFFMESDIKGVAWEGTELAKKKYGVGLSKFINGVLRNIFRNKEEIIKELKEKEEYDILYSYPKWLYQRLKGSNPEKYLEILKSYKKNGKLSIRVNKLKYSEEEFEKNLKSNEINILKKVDTVYYIDSAKILTSKIFKKGKIIVQDASSYLAARELGAKKGEKVLDACSAPGGKSLVIAENMENEGEILALDIHEHKIDLIKKNIEKSGIEIIETKIFDATKLEELDTQFDKILLDVPCSGVGVMRKKPEIIYNKTNENISKLMEIQRKILKSASKVLKAGGEMIYSTCTIIEDENKGNIINFLKNNQNFEVEKIQLEEDIKYTEDEIGGITIDYRNEYLDGFYMIKLKKK